MTLLYICFLFGLIAGLLIGAAGIGGVILVPLLVYVAGIDIHTSIAASVAAFFVSGLVGTVVYSQRGIIQWPDFVSVCVGAIPGALLGAYVLPKIESHFLTLFIALVLILSAVRQFIHSDSSNPVNPTRNRPKYQLAFVGLVTGFLSVLSGTGGPLVLLPLLTWLSMPLITAIGLSQVIQLPISTFATIGNVLNSLIDWELVLVLGFGVAFGSLLGAKGSELLPIAYIKTLVAFLLFASGVYMVLLLLFG
jgi:uncharacterized membrane protein YfcA